MLLMMGGVKVPVFGGDGDLGGHFWGDLDCVFRIDDEWKIVDVGWNGTARVQRIYVSYIFSVALRQQGSGWRDDAFPRCQHGIGVSGLAFRLGVGPIHLTGRFCLELSICTVRLQICNLQVLGEENWTRDSWSPGSRQQQS